MNQEKKDSRKVSMLFEISLLKEYLDALSILLKYRADNEDGKDVAFPIIYLFRHSLELTVKMVLKYHYFLKYKPNHKVILRLNNCIKDDDTLVLSKDQKSIFDKLRKDLGANELSEPKVNFNDLVDIINKHNVSNDKNNTIARYDSYKISYKEKINFLEYIQGDINILESFVQIHLLSILEFLQNKGAREGSPNISEK